MSSRYNTTMIVSVSRRCDIPRFQFDWFMEAVDAGFCETVNPFNANQRKRVPLLPQDVDLFVFWTRDPRHILVNAEELEKRGFSYYVMISLTGYPAILEPNLPPSSEVIAAIKELSQKIGPDRVIWRYDPVILTSVTDFDFHRENFYALSKELQGSVRRVIISLYDEYRPAKLRMEKLEKENEFRLIKNDDDVVGDLVLPLLADFARIAISAGMEIQSCAEKDLTSAGIKGGACIDAALIKKILGDNFQEKLQCTKDKNQRPNCLCCKSIDIGTYGTCAAGCVYCYAWR